MCPLNLKLIIIISDECDIGFETYVKYEWIVKLINNSEYLNLSLICSEKQNLQIKRKLDWKTRKCIYG